MDKMNPTKKKLLLKALRTPPDEGGYIQGQEALYSHVTVDNVYNPETDYWEDVDADEDRFCCLGVATDLAVQAGVCAWDDIALPVKDEKGGVDANFSDSYRDYFYNKKDAEADAKQYGGKVVRSDGRHEPIYYVYATTYETSSFPGSQVMKWFGFTPEVATEMARMNDEGEDFLKIADWVEATL